MDEKISANQMCYSTAKKFKVNVVEMYSDLNNYFQIYDLLEKIRGARQEEGSLT